MQAMKRWDHLVRILCKDTNISRHFTSSLDEPGGYDMLDDTREDGLCQVFCAAYRIDRLGQVPGFGYDVEIQSVHHIVRWTIRFFIVVCGWQISEVIYAEFSYNRASKNNMYNLVTFLK